MPNSGKLTLYLSLTLVIALVGCGGAETGSDSQTPSVGPGTGSDSASGDSPGQPPEAAGGDSLEVRVTGDYFSGTQVYEIPATAFYGNFFDSATYMNTQATGEGPGDFLAAGSDGSGLYRLSLQFQGGEPGSYPHGNGNEITLYLRNNGTPDPRCDQTAGSCVGVALSMIDGTIEVEVIEEVVDEHRVKLSFQGTFERTDTPGDGRDTYKVEGRADLKI